MALCLAIAATGAIAYLGAEQAPVAGPNRNIVGGPVTWDGTPFYSNLEEGDPYGQRQDEVSCTVDSRNARVLMCAFNDYTPVELPGLSLDGETGDAWIGRAWSTDGGLTWRNDLLPGYKQDTRPEGLASPLHGLDAAADPTWRSGPNGRSYLLAIAFNRGTASSSGAQSNGVLFLQAYVNNNNVENDPRPVAAVAPPVILDTGNTSQFQDKPWLAVGADGAVHVAYATFVSGNKPHSTIWYLVSKDGGQTFTKSKLSETDKVSNGTIISVHPDTGWVDVAWRRRESSLSNQTDAIEFVRSTDGGKSFTQPVTIVSLTDLQRADGSPVSRPFDQGTGQYYFRNISDPAIASDNNGRVYVAWSERVERILSPGLVSRDAQIKLTVGTAAKANGNTVVWSTPTPIDALTDPPTGTTRGHQFRPAMWFANGKLMLSYMHTRDDDMVSVFTRQDIADPGNPGGKVPTYVETMVPRGDLATSPPNPYKVFHDFIVDLAPSPLSATADVAPNFTNNPPLLRRHTEDVIALMGTPAPAGSSNVFPVFARTRVSRYAMTFQNGELTQAQANVLTRALHCGGNCAFAGDYDDVVAQAWVPNASATGWLPNVAPSAAADFYVAWTDNRDVRPFAAPTQFSRVGPTCTDPNATGTRNQNPYVARVGAGLFVFSYGNQKPLNTTFARAFTIVFRSAVNATKTYRAIVANQPAGGSASWLQFSPLTTLDLSIPPLSTASRALYATSSDPDAPIRVDVVEINAPGGTPVAGGLQSFTILNPDRSTPDLAAPASDPNVDPTDPAGAEVFVPDVTSPDVTSANVDVTPDVTSPDVTSPDVTSPDVTSVSAEFPDVTSPDVTSPDVTSPDVTSPDVTSPDVTSIAPGSALTDTIYEVTNKSNTSASFGIKTFVAQPLCAGCTLQAIVTSPSLSPTQRGCEPKNEDTSPLVASIPSPPLTSDPSALTFAPTDASAKNLTFSVPPGGRLSVTYRLYDPDAGNNVTFIDEFGRRHSVDPTFNPATDLIPVTIAQSVSTATATSCAPECPTQGIAAVPLIITTASLAGATYGAAYSASLSAFGGVSPYSFAVTAGSLPPGVMLSSGGVISGTPGAAGTFTFTVQVTDSASHTASRALTLVVAKAAATIALSNLSQTFDGTAKFATVTTTPAGLTVLVTYTQGGSPVSSPIAVGSYDVNAMINDANYAGTAAGILVIGKATAVLELTNLIQTYDGEPKPVTVTTTPAGLSGVAVTYDDSPTPPSAVGSYAVVATLTNDSYQATPVTGTLTIFNPVSATTYGFIGLQAPYGPPPKTFNGGRAIPLVWQYADPETNEPVDSSSADPRVEIRGPFACAEEEAGSIILITPGNSDLQYSSTTWKVNWQSPAVTAPSCFNIRVISNQTGQVNGPFLIELTP